MEKSIYFLCKKLKYQILRKSEWVLSDDKVSLETHSLLQHIFIQKDNSLIPNDTYYL